MARILVSEDDPHMLRLLSMWLARNGHQVVEATDGEAAQAVLASREVDLVISDVNMPRLGGMELVRWVRKELGRSVPMVLLSSRCDQMALGAELKQHDVKIHPKPFSPSRLMVEIDNLLNAKQVVGSTS